MVELIWDGKYDEDGKRVAPLKVSLPFQTVETVNESVQQRQKALDLFAAGRDLEWRNRLIWGDKKYVLPSLFPEFAGKVDLIYIDPPFATGANFSFDTKIGDDRFIREATVIEQKAYRDTWGRGISSYLSWFYKTLTMLHELLSSDGSIYVHCDWRLNGHVRLVLDEVFGQDQFRNEIIWCYTGASQTRDRFVQKHDTIYSYTKSGLAVFNWKDVVIPYSEETIARTGRGAGDAGLYGNQDAEQKHRHRLGKGGKIPEDWWVDIYRVQGNGLERVNYPTQKPEALLERIIRSSTSEADLVLDCFCGSGTTAVAAEKLNRRWIACDLGRFAVHTTRKRLLGIDNLRPFVVQNLGKYERQVWQKAEFGEDAVRITHAYRTFILDLYHAEKVDGYTWLHGKKGPRMVHVGSVDSPVAVGDVRNIAIDFQSAIGSGENAPGVAGVDILGWDFALDMNETAKQIAATAGLDVKFLQIPREVLEKKAVDQGDIRFFELAALSVNLLQRGRSITVELTDFMVPPDDVPDHVREAVRQWKDWIDYWAVDFNYRDDTFHNQWQSYRTRQDRNLLIRKNHTYDEPGDYIVLVKVIDVLGNDTTKTLNVKVV